MTTGELSQDGLKFVVDTNVWRFAYYIPAVTPEISYIDVVPLVSMGRHQPDAHVLELVRRALADKRMLRQENAHVITVLGWSLYEDHCFPIMDAYVYTGSEVLRAEDHAGDNLDCYVALFGMHATTVSAVTPVQIEPRWRRHSIPLPRVHVSSMGRT